MISLVFGLRHQTDFSSYTLHCEKAFFKRKTFYSQTAHFMRLLQNASYDSCQCKAKRVGVGGKTVSRPSHGRKFELS